MPPSARKTKTAAAAAAAAAAAIAGHPVGRSELEHVITEILKQPADGPLAQALVRAGISEVFDLLILSQVDRDSLTFLDTESLVTPLPLGLRNLLKVVRIYGPFCAAQGRPIEDWTEISKGEFDAFRCSTKCYNAIEFNTQVPVAPKLDPLADF